MDFLHLIIHHYAHNLLNNVLVITIKINLIKKK